MKNIIVILCGRIPIKCCLIFIFTHPIYSSEWYDQFHVDEAGPKKNEVKIEVLKIESDRIIAIIQNVSDRNFITTGRIDCITYFITNEQDEEDKLVAWDWDGTGKTEIKLLSQWDKLISVPRPMAKKGSNVYVKLEDSDTGTSSMILIYSEPKTIIGE